MKTLLLIHKTHLDIGYTDMAAKVTRQYLDHFIPAAIRRARELNGDAPSPRFVWTTGSWLVWKALREYDGEDLAALEDAIERGWIVWHALPFTFFTELLSPTLLRLALKFSLDLDRRFGRRTLSAKMTDVPGHTLGLVPVLAEAGVELLHIGVNPSSKVPEVPEVFRWRCQEAELIAVYAGTYGSVTTVEGCDTGLAFLHTNDNLGPPSVSRIAAEEAWLRARHRPEQLLSGGMDTFADALRPLRETLPVVEEEIGDSWIHGAASDPAKLAEYAALRRAVDAHAEALVDKPLDEISAWLEPLLLTAEHTWGLDAKGLFAANSAFRVHDLAAGNGLKSVQRIRAASEEQRAYPRAALAAMRGSLRDRAERELADSRSARDPVSIEGWMPHDIGAPLRAGRWLVRMDPAVGCLSGLHDLESGRDLTPPTGRFSWGIPGYALHGSEEYRAYLDAYMGPPPRPWWAEEDFSRMGLHHELPRGMSATLREEGAYVREGEGRTQVLVRLSFQGEAEAMEGAPSDLTVCWTFDHTAPVMNVELRWSRKAATRLPEAGWFGFQLPADLQSIRLSKLGREIDPASVVAGGGRHLHALDGPVRCSFADGARLNFHSPDALLVSPGAPRMLRDPAAPVSDGKSVWFQLFNNLWNTNFPLWSDGAMGYRFQIELQ